MAGSARSLLTPVRTEVAVPVYAPEESIADGFRLRNKTGTMVAVEALATWLGRGRASIPKLLEYAHIDGVERVILPYPAALQACSGHRPF